MLAVPVEGDHRGPLPPVVSSPAPGRDPVLRAAPGVRPVQLLDRVPPGPPITAPLAHLEVLVTTDLHIVCLPAGGGGSLLVNLIDLVAITPGPDGSVIHLRHGGRFGCGWSPDKVADELARVTAEIGGRREGVHPDGG